MDTFIPGDRVRAKRGSSRIMTIKEFIEEDGTLAGYRLVDNDGLSRFFRHDDLKPEKPKRKKRRRKS